MDIKTNENILQTNVENVENSANLTTPNITDDEKIELIADIILKEYKVAFEELAK